MLRRMTHALRERNWTTILIEFVLLACSVFLGIQAANWNATQQEQALEAEFIERLQRDFRVIDARLADDASRWQEKAAAPVRLLADLEAFRKRGRWPRAKETMLHVLEETMNGRIPAPRASTYIELLSAGKLGLIRNTRLRDALLAADPKLKVALNMYATSSANQLQVALMQQKKALAVSSILESGARRSGESR